MAPQNSQHSVLGGHRSNNGANPPGQYGEVMNAGAKFGMLDGQCPTDNTKYYT